MARWFAAPLAFIYAVEQRDQWATNMKILVVEDETKTGAYLRKGLIESGFMVNLASSGLDGQHLALTESYDLIILDVMLPDISGWHILKSIRDAEVLTPVLFLTAKDNVEDKVKGLELGADDYLVKPFAFIELLARVRTILRRGQFKLVSDVFSIDDLQLDVKKHLVTRAGETINLTNREFALLELLIRRQGEVLPRALIASEIWDMNFDGDANVIDVAIRRLRMKVDENAQTKLIHTVRGMGYQLDVLSDD